MATTPFKYAPVGAPFNFSGHHTESQKNAFKTWVNDKTATLGAVQTHHQIRAQQLRKTAGLLEAFYADTPDKLSHSFVKAQWKPDNPGHFAYSPRNDHEPAVVVAGIKKPFQPMLIAQDEGVFQMNQVRGMIERHEDLAQHSNDAVKGVPALLNRLDVLFGKEEYQAVLVHDTSDLYQGLPRYRVNPLDDPTPWERAIMAGQTAVI